MSTVEAIKDKKRLKRVEKFLSKNKRDLLIFNIGINCGLRVSDILNLDVGDVKNKNLVQIKEKKTDKIKQFPINSKLKPMIEEFTKGKNLNEPLFTTIFKNRMERTYVYKIIKKACQKANLDIKVGTHTMRKTFGYHHYKQFNDIAMLQKIFNHSSQDVTLRYIGIEQDEINESYKNFIL